MGNTIRNAKKISDLSDRISAMEGHSGIRENGMIALVTKGKHGIRKYSLFWDLDEETCGSDDDPILESYYTVYIALIMHSDLRHLHPNN
jgi:hypothetical protein